MINSLNSNNTVKVIVTDIINELTQYIKLLIIWITTNITKLNENPERMIKKLLLKKILIIRCAECSMLETNLKRGFRDF